MSLILDRSSPLPELDATATCPSNHGLPREYNPGPLQTVGVLLCYSPLGDIAPRAPDMYQAIGMWQTATRARFDLAAVIVSPVGHYSVSFSDELPADVWGRTERDDGRGVRPGRTSLFQILLNRRVRFNEVGQPPRDDEVDFVSVFAHEIGHAIGLSHLNDRYANVMFEGIYPGDRKNVEAGDVRCMNELVG